MTIIIVWYIHTANTLQIQYKYNPTQILCLDDYHYLPANHRKWLIYDFPCHLIQTVNIKSQTVEIYFENLAFFVAGGFSFRVGMLVQNYYHLLLGVQQLSLNGSLFGLILSRKQNNILSSCIHHRCNGIDPETVRMTHHSNIYAKPKCHVSEMAENTGIGIRKLGVKFEVRDTVNIFWEPPRKWDRTKTWEVTEI